MGQQSTPTNGKVSYAFRVVIRYQEGDKDCREIETPSDRQAIHTFTSERLLNRSGVWLFYKGLGVKWWGFDSHIVRCALVQPVIATATAPLMTGFGRWPIEAMRDAIERYELMRWMDEEEDRGIPLQTALLATQMEQWRRENDGQDTLLTKALDIREAVGK